VQCGASGRRRKINEEKRKKERKKKEPGNYLTGPV
jgi:hypothetical protein